MAAFRRAVSSWRERWLECRDVGGSRFGRSVGVAFAFAVEGGGVDAKNLRGLVHAVGDLDDAQDVLALEFLEADAVADHGAGGWRAAQGVGEIVHVDLVARRRG